MRNVTTENILPAVIFDVTRVTGMTVAFVGSEITETSRGEPLDCKEAKQMRMIATTAKIGRTKCYLERLKEPIFALTHLINFV